MTEMTLDTLIRLVTEKARSMGMRIELVAHAPEDTTEPTDRLTAIEVELAKMRELWRMHANDCFSKESRQEYIRSYFGWGPETIPAPAQTRTYPVVERESKDPGIAKAYVNGEGIGAVYNDGDWFFFGGSWQGTRGSVESAKAALESKFRRWWDELHNLNSTTQTT